MLHMKGCREIKPSPSKKNCRLLILGSTLLELMLVLVISSTLILMLINDSGKKVQQKFMKRTALEIQQILNSAAAYYNAYGKWPATCNIRVDSSGNVNSNADNFTNTLSTLVTAGYYPSSATSNVYQFQYKVDCDPSSGKFYLNTQVASNTIQQYLAQSIAGMVPLAYASDGQGVAPTPPATTARTSLYVTASITIPLMNLNNANTVNFAGIYQHGTCVPVPSCPGYNLATSSCISGTNCLKPKIIVEPAVVIGANSYDSVAKNFNTYPIVAFYAYATGPTIAPDACSDGNVGVTCTGSSNNYYWRVCLQVNTEQGKITNATTVKLQNLLVMTRCGL